MITCNLALPLACQVKDWVNWLSILTADLSFEYMDIKRLRNVLGLLLFSVCRIVSVGVYSRRLF